MAKYMLLLGGADLDKRSQDPAFGPQIIQHFKDWLGTLQANGHYVTSHKLRDQTGARLSARGGEVVGGPFMEAKEAVGGVFIIEAASLEQAISLAQSSPTLRLQ